MMNVLELYAVLFKFFVFCLFYTQAVEVKDCGSHLTFTDVQLEECLPEDSECGLLIGGRRQISFVLNTGNFDINASLVNDVAMYLRGIRFNLTTVPTNPCDVLSCPFQQNYVGAYSGEIQVDETYLPLRASLRWILRTSDHQEQLLCFEIPVVLLP